jgi:hypothetical protein
MPLYTIDIGAAANDGTGDPLRTAFNETNLNFEQVFAAGPVLSNVQIANNTILTTNTNGNLVLAPNGIGVVQANVNIVPNTANIRNLGAADRRWSTVYVQYANVSGGLGVANLTATGDVTVGGNLSVTGNIVYIGNLITDAKTIQLANTAGTANAANGSGITVGANDNIATMLYSSATNAWTFNIGVDAPNIVVNNITSDDSTFVTIQDGLDVQGDITAETLNAAGNVTGNYILGNISQASGFPATYGNANVATFLAAFGSNTISTTGNVTVGNILPAGYVSAAGNVRGANFNTDGTVSAIGNITGNYFVGNGSQLTGIVSSYGNANVVANLSNLGSNPISTTGNVTANNFIGLLGNITNLDSLNFAVENIGALVGNNGVNIGAGGYNNLVVLPTDVLIQNVPLTVDTLIVNQIRSDDSSFVTIEDGLNVNGDVTADTVTTTGNISATGNVSGAYVKGNGSELTNLPAPTVAQDIVSTGAMSIMLYDGNIKYNNYATVEPASGNITGGNILTGGLVSATGNITGNYILGNGSQLTSINAARQHSRLLLCFGYRDIPQVSFTGNATIATTDAGKHYYSTLSTGNVLTIANNASQGFQVGAAITIVNQGTGNITVAQGSGVTLYLAGNATSGNRTVATFGMATIMKVATDTWFINGTGVS